MGENYRYPEPEEDTTDPMFTHITVPYPPPLAAGEAPKYHVDGGETGKIFTTTGLPTGEQSSTTSTHVALLFKGRSIVDTVTPASATT